MPIYGRSMHVFRPQTSSAMFLKYNSQLGPPFHVIVDTNFVNFSIKYRIDMMQGFMDCLYAKSKLFFHFFIVILTRTTTRLYFLPFQTFETTWNVI